MKSGFALSGSRALRSADDTSEGSTSAQNKSRRSEKRAQENGRNTPLFLLEGERALCSLCVATSSASSSSPIVFARDFLRDDGLDFSSAFAPFFNLSPCSVRCSVLRTSVQQRELMTRAGFLTSSARTNLHCRRQARRCVADRTSRPASCWL